MNEHINEHNGAAAGASSRKDPRGSTIQASDVNRLAANERRRLLRGLERFANLGDTLDELRAFRRAWRDFWPLAIYDADAGRGGEIIPVGLTDELHELVLAVRDLLREVWRGDNSPGRMIGLLLKKGHLTESEQFRLVPGETLKTLLGLNCPQLESLLANARRLVPCDNGTLWSDLAPNWRTGNVDFRPRGLFHQSVYVLWRESWRAKVCPECGTYFIADKPPQRYCSPACYGQAKRQRDLSWWRSYGAQWRQNRLNRKRPENKKGRKRHGHL